MTPGLAVLGAAITTTAIWACSDDHPGAASPAAGGANPPTYASTPGDAAADANGDGATDAGDVAAACVVAVSATDPVPITIMPGATRPEPTGGSIGLGRFKLTERNFYPDPSEPDAGAGEVENLKVARSYSFLANDSFEAAEITQAGSDPAVTTSSSGTFTAIDMIFSAEQTCPFPTLTNARFSVNGGQAPGQELWLFPREKYREVYVRE